MGLRRWYINVTIINLDIIHRSNFYFRQYASETGIESSFWNISFKIKDRTKDNVQNRDSYGIFVCLPYKLKQNFEKIWAFSKTERKKS
jgi:hypothetical protein